MRGVRWERNSRMQDGSKQTGDDGGLGEVKWEVSRGRSTRAE